MALRKRTLRRLPPLTREYARIIGELESATKRAKSRLAKLEALELQAAALANHSCTPAATINLNDLVAAAAGAGRRPLT